MGGSREHVAQFLSIAESPNRPEAAGTIVAEQFADQMLLPLVACRQHDQVGGERFPATHARSCRHEGGDIGELRQSDLAFDDQIGTTDIEVVTAAAGEVLELPAAAVFAEIELEAAALEPIQQFFVHVPRGFGQCDVAFPYQWKRHRRRDEIAILQRKSFVIERVLQLRTWLDIDDHGRAALHERDLRSGRMQVLRDIMAAVARADDENVLAPPCLAVVVLTGVQNFAAEVAQARNIRKARNAAHAGGHHDVARVHLPLRAVGQTQDNGPSVRFFVVAAAFEFGAGPIIQLQAFHIGLEPGGQLVFGNVGRPVWRKRHVRQVVDLHLVVQDQRVIALAPVVADARFAVDDQRIEP